MRNVAKDIARTIMVLMKDSADHISGKEGLTLTITASKAGGAFGAITPDVTERGDGWYAVALTAAMLNTYGDYAIHIEAPGADPADLLLDVVGYNPVDSVGLGLSRIADIAAATALNGSVWSN